MSPMKQPHNKVIIRVLQIQIHPEMGSVWSQRWHSDCCVRVKNKFFQDLKNMDAEVIFSKQLKQIEKEKRDKEIKLKSQEKKVGLVAAGFLEHSDLAVSCTGGLL